jgi:hypothetical protein
MHIAARIGRIELPSVQIFVVVAVYHRRAP